MSRVIIGDKELTSVEWRNEYVMTTATLSYFFVVSEKNISDNFKNNEARFVEGKHYFRIEGLDLKKLRSENFGMQISPMTRTLYLWTRRGVARHAKMINSDVAWDIFELLEDAYFNRDEAEPTPKRAFFGDEFKFKQPPTDFERGVQLKKLASHTRNPELREQLIIEAANLIAGKEIYSEKRFF